MAEKTLNTVIVLRNDDKSSWEADEAYVLRDGEVGVGYFTVTDDEGNNKRVVMAKIGNGKLPWKQLPQLEGVFEADQILTYDFGRHKTSNGYVNAGGAGMTTSQWLLDALSEVLAPTVNYPGATLACGTITTDTGDKEIGSKITKFAWAGTPSYGSYKDAANSGTYGTKEDKTSGGTGLGASNFTWSISNSLDTQTGSTEDGTFTLDSANYQQLNSEASTTYAYLNGSVTLDASKSRTPLNNVGAEYADGKIAGFDKAGTTEKAFTDVAVACGAFRKPFWGVLTTAYDIGTLTSANVRDLSGKGTKNDGFPTTLAVAAGSRQVIFCAKAGVYKTLAAKDTAAMNAGVTFTKHASAVSVNGANNFTATEYDVWEVTWADPIASAKSLSLTWTK